MTKPTYEQLEAHLNKCQSQRARLENQLSERDRQVTLLWAVMNRIAFSRTGQCTDLAQELFAREEWAAEALADTAPKEEWKCQSSPRAPTSTATHSRNCPSSTT